MQEHTEAIKKAEEEKNKLEQQITQLQVYDIVFVIHAGYYECLSNTRDTVGKKQAAYDSWFQASMMCQHSINIVVLANKRNFVDFAFKAKMLTGGRRVEDTVEFQEAIQEVRMRLKAEQEEQLADVEKQRAKLDAERQAFEESKRKWLEGVRFLNFVKLADTTNHHIISIFIFIFRVEGVYILIPV